VSKRGWIALGLGLAVIAIAAAALVWSGDGGGESPVPDTAGDAGVVEGHSADSTGPARISAEVTTGDPVPDDVVDEVFGLLDDAGFAPTMNATYSVKFGEDTDSVLVQGEFESGERTFEFRYTNGQWKLLD
jgi:hypothetical protein